MNLDCGIEPWWESQGKKWLPVPKHESLIGGEEREKKVNLLVGHQKVKVGHEVKWVVGIPGEDRARAFRSWVREGL